MTIIKTEEDSSAEQECKPETMGINEKANTRKHTERCRARRAEGEDARRAAALVMRQRKWLELHGE